MESLLIYWYCTDDKDDEQDNLTDSHKELSLSNVVEKLEKEVYQNVDIRDHDEQSETSEEDDDDDWVSVDSLTEDNDEEEEDAEEEEIDEEEEEEENGQNGKNLVFHYILKILTTDLGI